MFSLKVLGAEALADKFRDYARSSPGSFDKVMGKWARGVAYKLKSKPYPPMTSGQRYRRTRTLKGSWEAKRDQSLQWQITNTASRRGQLYAGFVVGDQQAWMHAGRWWKASEEIEKEMGDLTDKLGQEIEKLLF